MKRIVAAAALSIVIGFPLAASAEGEGRQPAGGAFMSSYSQAPLPAAAAAAADPQRLLPKSFSAPRYASAGPGRHPRR
jgi:hypothetical protein